MPTEYIIQIAQWISRKSNFQFVSVENVFHWKMCDFVEGFIYTSNGGAASFTSEQAFGSIPHCWWGIWTDCPVLFWIFSIDGQHFIYRNIFQFKTLQPKLTLLGIFVVPTCVSFALHPFVLCAPLALHPSFFHCYSRSLSVCRSLLRVWWLRQHHTANISNSKQCFIPTPRIIINILQAYFWF